MTGTVVPGRSAGGAGGAGRVTVFACVAVLVIGTAGPAAAHAGGLTPRGDRPVVTGIAPAVPGLRATMVNNGTELELRNDGASTVTVRADVTGTAARVVRPGETVRFRDPRTGWLAGTPTDAAARRVWRVPIATGAGEAAILGEVRWREQPNPIWWALGMVGLVVAGYLIGRSGWWRPGLALAALVVTAAHIGHVMGSVLAVTGQGFVPLFIGASGVGVVCWPLAVIAVVAAARGRPSAAFAAAVAGAALVVAGIPDLDSFRYAQLPFAGPAELDRLALAVSLGGGTGLAVGGFTAMRRFVGR